MKKINVLLIIFTMFIYTFSTPVYALANAINADEYKELSNTLNINKEEDLHFVTFDEELLESVPLLSSIDEEQEELMLLLNTTPLKVLEKNEEYSLVEIKILDEHLLSMNDHLEIDTTVEGYIENEFITPFPDIENDEDSDKVADNELDESLPNPEITPPLDDKEDTSDDTAEDNTVPEEEFAETPNDVEVDLTEEDEDANIDLTPDTSPSIKNEEIEDEKLIEDEEEDKTKEKIQTSQHSQLQMAPFSLKSNNLRGVAKKSPTNIRASASTKAKAIKKLPIGSVINYENHSEHWYRTTVNVGGNTVYGFIHKKHITTVTTVPQNLKGVAKKGPTNVRAGASTKSKIIKQFPIGSVIHYKSFSKNWNEITVNVNGQNVSGFIHKKHVTNLKTVPTSFKGIAKKSSTKLYAGASINAKTVTTVPIGNLLQAKTLSKNWLEVTTIVNGKNVSGYMLKTDVTKISTKPKAAKVVTLKQPTNIRVGASTKANVLGTIPKARSINVMTFSKNWYSYTSNINGKKQTGYIHKKHVGENVISTTTYNLTLNQAVNIQKGKLLITSAPSTMYVHKDALKKENGKWVVTANNWNVRSGPSTSSKIVGQISKNTLKDTSGTITVDEKNSTKDFYKFKTGWIHPTEAELRKYLNPNSFNENSVEYYQFLVLSQPAGTNATDVNNKILSTKGVLKGKASSFINAATKHNVNELYLISHAVLETGGGTSPLAKGHQVGVNASGKPELVTDKNKSKLKNIKTVYNMYGIGAQDGIANEGGAIKAYQEGWTSVDKAIQGGAKFIAEKYIAPGKDTHSGQDTLYKMRWHPEGMVKLGSGNWHQYATDTQWATKQTRNLKNYYDLLSEYTLIFDVPKYK